MTYEVFSGAVLVVVGIVLLIGSIRNINRDPDVPNSPFLWVFLFAGLLLAGFGVVLLVLG
jgi:hypothetical protein